MPRQTQVSRHEVKDALAMARKWAASHAMWVNCLALVGSVREGEAVRGYSDLDLLFLLKADRAGTIPPKCVRALRRLASRLTEVSPLTVSLLPHTHHDLREYVDVSYLLHYQRGEVLYGSPRGFVRAMGGNKRAAARSVSKSLEGVCRIYILHARFNMTRKYVSAGAMAPMAEVRALTKTLLDWVLEIADWALLWSGVEVVGKEALATRFSAEFPSLANAGVPLAAVALRRRWPKWTADEALQFQTAAIAFVSEVAVCVER
jgi:hypothetical protein